MGRLNLNNNQSEPLKVDKIKSEDVKIYDMSIDYIMEQASVRLVGAVVDPITLETTHHLYNVRFKSEEFDYESKIFAKLYENGLTNIEYINDYVDNERLKRKYKIEERNEYVDFEEDAELRYGVRTVLKRFKKYVVDEKYRIHIRAMYIGEYDYISYSISMGGKKKHFLRCDRRQPYLFCSSYYDWAYDNYFPVVKEEDISYEDLPYYIQEFITKDYELPTERICVSEDEAKSLPDGIELESYKDKPTTKYDLTIDPKNVEIVVIGEIRSSREKGIVYEGKLVSKGLNYTTKVLVLKNSSSEHYVSLDARKPEYDIRYHSQHVKVNKEDLSEDTVTNIIYGLHRQIMTNKPFKCKHTNVIKHGFHSYIYISLCS